MPLSIIVKTFYITFIVLFKKENSTTICFLVTHTQSHDLAFHCVPSHKNSLNTHKKFQRAPEQGHTHTNEALLYTVSEDGGIRLTVCCTKACGWQEKMTQVRVFGPAWRFWKEPFMCRMTLLWNGKFLVNSTLTLVWITGFQVGQRPSGPFWSCTAQKFRSWSKSASRSSAVWTSVKCLVTETHNHCGTSCYEQA